MAAQLRHRLPVSVWLSSALSILSSSLDENARIRVALSEPIFGAPPEAHKFTVMEVTLMKPGGPISMVVLLLLGTVASTYAQQEQQNQAISGRTGAEG